LGLWYCRREDVVLCMPRALIGQWLLQRQGIAVDLRIGVRRDLDGLKAHAWLECGGQPIGEPEELLGRYAPLVAPLDQQ